LRVLLDHNLDRRLKTYLPAHEVQTTYEKGWQTLLNGELLDRAEQEFDVMLTADTNIKHQQIIASRSIAIITLRAFNNRLATHTEMMAEVNQVLLTIKAGELIEVLHEDVKQKLANP
jgi:predicted nuclease of predicted toxin-antitoxin system